MKRVNVRHGDNKVIIISNSISGSSNFVYLIQELRSDCVHLSNKYAKIAMPFAPFLNQINKIRETEI